MKLLIDALSRMRATAVAPFGDMLDKPIDTDAELARMVRDIGILSAGNRLQRKESPAAIDLARARWSAAKGDLGKLTGRQIRALCSDVHVATSPSFVAALARNAELPTRRRWIESLVASYFSGWRPPEAEALESLLKKLVKNFKGRSARITLCKPVAEALFSPEAATWLGSLVVEKHKPWEKVLEDWSVERAGRLGRESANASVDAWMTRSASARGTWPSSKAKAELEFLLRTLLAPDVVTNRQFSKAISHIILWPHIEKDEGLMETTRAFVLKHPSLGDPRHRPSNWSSCDPEAYHKARAWFSRADLEYFFKFVIRDDPHRRKSFWLDYIDRVEVSNVALCEADAQRVRAHAAERPHYSRAVGANNVSAFIMRFPGSSAILVEFSQPGNALYCHDATKFDKHVRGGITQPTLQIRDELKHQGSMRWREVHRDQWQHKVRNLLAGMGIRPQ